MPADRFLHLLTKQLSASLTAEEESEWQAFLLDDENAAAYRHLKKFWQAKSAEQSPNVEKALSKVRQEIAADPTAPQEDRTAPPRRLRWRKPSMAAAALLVLAYFVFQPTKPLPASYNKPTVAAAGGLAEKQNAKGTRSIITLADGSKVWLNADSKLQYPVSFEGDTREVSLSGEAFFDVAKNRQKPFVIHLKNGTVRVLGTSFNIKAYDNSPVVETSVATGRVAFIPKTGKADTVFLTHDLKAVYRVPQGKVTTVKTASAEDKAWTDGKLLFNDAGLEEIATTLERNFGKPVLINDDELKAYRFTGSFANDRLEDILYYLTKSKPFTYRITETQVILAAVR